MAEDKLSSWLTKKLFASKKENAPSANPNPHEAELRKKEFASGASAQASEKRVSWVQMRAKPSLGNKSLTNKPMIENEQKTRQSHSHYTQSGSRNLQTGAAGNAISGTGFVRICALGGLNEVGKNMMFFEYRRASSQTGHQTGAHQTAAVSAATRTATTPATGHDTDIVIVDMGFQFPEENMLGIDYVIPDITYLLERKHQIRGILLTHGHLDHIGAIPYLIEKLGYPPIYGTKLTIGFVKKRLEEFGLMKLAKIHTFHPDDTLRLGHFTANFFRVNHSIPDAVGIFLQSPAGNFVHTGDFKFDLSPSGDQQPAEFSKIASLANRNITALFSDSTNALKPGQTMSEQKIAKNLEEIIKKCEGRVIITAFSSLIGRLQQLLDFAQKHKRQVFLTGRSMLDSMEISRNLGYLKYPNNLIHDIAKLKSFPDNRIMILTTGSQGEDVSALTRISIHEHPHIKLKKGDTVIISATPIVGNERAVTKVINNLCRQGAKVVHSKTVDVHTSGHACQEDLKLMITLVKPKYLVPVHGEYHMRMAHKELAVELGMKEQNGIVVENGDMMEVKNGMMHVSSEKVPVNYIMVDGLGMGDIGTHIIEERLVMSENGVMVVLLTVKGKKLIRDPEIISRGFIYMQESEKIMEQLAKTAKDTYRKIFEKKSDASRTEIKRYMRAALDKKAHELLERRPLILPIMIEHAGSTA